MPNILLEMGFLVYKMQTRNHFEKRKKKLIKFIKSVKITFTQTKNVIRFSFFNNILLLLLIIYFFFVSRANRNVIISCIICIVDYNKYIINETKWTEIPIEIPADFFQQKKKSTYLPKLKTKFIYIFSSYESKCLSDFPNAKDI